LKNASKVTDALDGALCALYGSDSTEGAVALIKEAEAQTAAAARYADSFKTVAERLKDLLYKRPGHNGGAAGPPRWPGCFLLVSWTCWN
jgi:DNA repair ATPase RecN